MAFPLRLELPDVLEDDDFDAVVALAEQHELAAEIHQRDAIATTAGAIAEWVVVTLGSGWVQVLGTAGAAQLWRVTRPAVSRTFARLRPGQHTGLVIRDEQGRVEHRIPATDTGDLDERARADLEASPGTTPVEPGTAREWSNSAGTWQPPN